MSQASIEHAKEDNRAKDNKKESAGSKIFIGLLVGLVVAVGTAICGYVISYMDQHRKDQVAFVNTQIEKLYGPLYAVIQANDKAWEQFHQSYWPKRNSFFPADVAVKPEDIDLWRRWMRNVFQPMNVNMENALINNAQLVVGEQMPPMFLQLIAHIEAYKAVIAKWSHDHATKEDVSACENVAPIPFPNRSALKNCIEEQFHSLKSLQQTLQEQFVGQLQPLKEEVPQVCKTSMKIEPLTCPD